MYWFWPRISIIWKFENGHTNDLSISHKISIEYWFFLGQNNILTVWLHPQKVKMTHGVQQVIPMWIICRQFSTKETISGGIKWCRNGQIDLLLEVSKVASCWQHLAKLTMTGNSTQLYIWLWLGFLTGSMTVETVESLPFWLFSILEVFNFDNLRFRLLLCLLAGGWVVGETGCFAAQPLPLDN